MPKGNRQMNDVPKGTQSPDKRGINTDIKPSWEGRKVADAFDKLQGLKKLKNVGKRNIGVDSPDGGAVYDPKQLIKPMAPQKQGKADEEGGEKQPDSEDAEKKKVAKMSDKAWANAKKKANIIT